MKQGAAGPVIAIVIGAALALFALYGLITSAVNGVAAGMFGVVIWGGLAALFLTLGIRALGRVKRQDDAR